MEDNVIVIVFRFSYQTQQKLGNSLSVIVPASASPLYKVTHRSDSADVDQPGLRPDGLLVPVSLTITFRYNLPPHPCTCFRLMARSTRSLRMSMALVMLILLLPPCPPPLPRLARPIASSTSLLRKESRSPRLARPPWCLPPL